MTTTGSETVCIGILNNQNSIGDGTAAYDSKTITIGDGTTSTFVRRANGATVISLRDKNTIIIKNKATVQGDSSSKKGEKFNFGPNVIECVSHNTITIDADATVLQIGSTTTGEPINVIGFGNKIINYGTLQSYKTAAIWFEDKTIAPDLARRNKVVNYGTIATANGDTHDVIGSSQNKNGPGLIFENYGTIKGSLSFAAGNDSLTFGAGSHVTGNVDGNGGTNDLTLDAALGEADILGTIANFASITKTGAGTWSVLGGDTPKNTLTNIDSLLVKEGLLHIVGAAPQFTGSVQIDSSGSLNVQAAGINNANSVVNNGTLIFVESKDADYTGQAITGHGMVIKQGGGNLTVAGVDANTYGGGMWISAGGILVNKDSDLGAPTGGLILGTDTSQGTADNGMLQLNAAFDLAATRAITIRDGGGTINTNGHNTAISQNIDGTGSLTKTGDGLLALYGNNSFTGGTVIADGAVAVKNAAGTCNGDIYLGTFGRSINLKGVLRFDADVDYEAAAPSGAIFINDGGGTLDTSAFTATLREDTLRDGSGAASGLGGGAGSLHKVGDGVLSVLGNQSYSGATFVDDGIFRLDAFDSSHPAANTQGLSNTSALNIAPGARLEGQGLVGNGNTLTTNSGVIAPGVARHGHQLFTALTLNGDYKANEGAAVEIGTQLKGDASPRSTLIINGQITADSAVTGVRVVNLGGGGGATNAGIQIIRVLGSADHDAVGQKFRLLSDFTAPNGQPAVVAGAYTYILEADYDYDYAAGSYNINAAGMFLRNYKKADGTNGLNPSTPLYESYALVLGNSNSLPTLEQRVGHRNWLNATGREPLRQGGVWLWQEGAHGAYKPLKGSGSGTKYNLDYAHVNLGFDYPVIELDNKSVLMAGVNLDFGWGKAKVMSDIARGTINTTSHGAGITLTWYDINDFYIDSQARYNWYSSDIKSSAINSAKYQINDNAGDGYAFSLKAGQVFALNETWSMTPQVQLMYSEASFDSFIDTQNTKVANPKSYMSLEGRLGLAFSYEKSCASGGEISRTKFYGLPNYYHEFMGASSVSLADVKYESEFNKDWLGLTMGVSRNWANDKYSLHGEVGVKSSLNNLGNEYEFTVEAGLCRYF